MSRVRKPPRSREPGLRETMKTPDALAVFDDDGELIGFDESEAHAYLLRVGLPTDCDDECRRGGCVILI